jgi:tetratricopeptide (TPR) repeat protein
MSSSRDEIQAIRKKVDVYVTMGRFDAAEKLLKSSIADYGDAANLLNLLGLVYLKQSRLPEAVSYFRKAVNANPKFVESILNLAVTLCDLSEYDEAQQVFLQAKASISPKQPVPELVLGRLANQHASCGKLYEENSMHHDAIREYRKALSVFAKMPDVKLSLGKLLLQTGKLDEAKSEFEELVRMDPDSPNPRIWLGITYYKFGFLDLAAQQWGLANKSFPFDFSAKAYAKISATWQARPES